MKLVPKKSPETQPPKLEPAVWVKAVYHLHVFHYRMPETAAIAAITPFVPSPLTVKMAMVAALLQKGEKEKAKQLAPYLPQMEIRIVPPKAAFSFRAFMRYRSVPAVESAGGLDESGSFYPSRPHTREYALLSDDLTVFIGLPDTSSCSLVEEALKNIRYLGCKDSQVWCRKVEKVGNAEVEGQPVITRLSEGQAGSVVLLADFAPQSVLKLEDLIPGKRKKEHYQLPNPPYVLPGKIKTSWRTKIFFRTG